MAYKIDKRRLGVLEKELMAAMEEVAAKHKVALSWKGGHYGDTADLKLSIAPIGDDGVVNSAERDAWFRHDAQGPRLRGLDPSILDMVITLRGEPFKVVGLALNRRKYCVVTERVSDGGTVFYTAVGVRRAAGLPCPECKGHGDKPCFACE